MIRSLAIIQFPGSNCEYETQKAAAYYGLEASIIRWNCEASRFHDFDAYMLPGGFSYQDRVRAGVISAKLPIMSLLEQAAEQGKPILGICNGCQILAETGLVPNVAGSNLIEMSLARNAKAGDMVGFMCDWVYVKIEYPEKNIFTRYFDASDIVPIPINHGEGRFLFKEGVADLIEPLTKVVYCDDQGHVSSDYPVNPNGSTLNIAALGNQSGNVLGMMPHPERAAFSKQVPHSFSVSSEGRVEGPWEKLFTGLKEYEGRLS